jgi:hypothetical protein
MRTDGAGDAAKLSTQSATLDAIRGKGEPIMESQMVVDHTELDGNGFFVARDGSGSYAVNDLTAQIRSIELRAVSRDSEALTLDEAINGKDKYMLSLESRELRGQAQKAQERTRRPGGRRRQQLRAAAFGNRTVSAGLHRAG